LAERALDGFQARVEAGTAAIGKQRSLRTLAAWGRLRILISERIAGSVAMNRREGATWAEIAAALGVTRQTAHQRFRADNEPDG
jgi:Homeodomain-like domain-containing protein